jgi:hypothetical protein
MFFSEGQNPGTGIFSPAATILKVLDGAADK